MKSRVFLVLIIIILVVSSCSLDDNLNYYGLNSHEISVLKNLEKKYGTLNTTAGKTKFEFRMYSNDSLTSAHDYWLMVEFDWGFFLDLQYSIKISNETNHIVCQELQDHQEKIAMAIMAAFPGKKIHGGYYISGYKYPNIREGFYSYNYYSWRNYYGPGVLPYGLTYWDYEVDGFYWTTYMDTKGLRRE